MYSQLLRCKKYTQARGWNISRVFREEGVSGGKLNRPSLDAMLDYIEKNKNISYVVVDDYKRWARHLDYYLLLKNKLELLGCKLASPSGSFDDSPEGNALENMQAVFSQLERQQNARQVTNRMKARTEMGFWPYAVFPGYKPSPERGIREPDGFFANVIKEVLEGYAYGHFTSYEEMARFVNDQHVTNYRNKKVVFDGDHIKCLIKHSWYHAGFVQLKKRGVPRIQGKHKAIISTDVLELIEARQNGKAVPKYRKNMNQHFPLKGHVLCSCCHKPMTASFCGKGDKYAYYYCKTSGCEMYSSHVPHNKVHDEFEGLLISLELPEPLKDHARSVFDRVWKKEMAGLNDKRTEYRTQINQHSNQINKLLDELMATNSQSVKTAIGKRIDEVTSTREILSRKLNELSSSGSEADTVFHKVIDVLENPFLHWKDGSLSIKQAIQRIIFPSPLILDQKEKKFRKPEKPLFYRLIEKLKPKKEGLVDPIGIEPTTSCMPCKRSPS